MLTSCNNPSKQYNISNSQNPDNASIGLWICPIHMSISPICIFFMNIKGLIILNLGCGVWRGPWTGYEEPTSPKSWPESCSSGSFDAPHSINLPGPSAFLTHPGQPPPETSVDWQSQPGAYEPCLAPIPPTLTCSGWFQFLELCCLAHCYKACCQCLSNLNICAE